MTEAEKAAILLALLNGSALKVSFPVERRDLPDMPSFTYYIAKEGPFEITEPREDYYYRFEGVHFICLGSDYFYHRKDAIVGFEVFDQPYEVIPFDQVPKDLHP